MQFALSFGSVGDFIGIIEVLFVVVFLFANARNARNETHNLQLERRNLEWILEELAKVKSENAFGQSQTEAKEYIDQLHKCRDECQELITRFWSSNQLLDARLSAFRWVIGGSAGVREKVHSYIDTMRVTQSKLSMLLKKEKAQLCWSKTHEEQPSRFPCLSTICGSKFDMAKEREAIGGNIQKATQDASVKPKEATHFVPMNSDAQTTHSTFEMLFGPRPITFAERPSHKLKMEPVNDVEMGSLGSAETEASDTNDADINNSIVVSQTRQTQQIQTGTNPAGHAPFAIRNALRQHIQAAPWRLTRVPEPTIGDGYYPYLDPYGPRGVSIYFVFCNTSDPHLMCLECGYKARRSNPVKDAVHHQRIFHHFHSV